MFLNSAADYGWTVWEDFLTNDAITDGLIGKASWELVALSGGADTLTYETAAGETFMRMTGTGGGANDGTAVSLAADKVTFGQYGGFCRFGFRIPDITSNAIAGQVARIGFSSVIAETEPVVGLWCDVAAGVVSFDAASANGDVTAAAAGPTSLLTSGTTAILGTTYNAEIKWWGNNGNADPGPSSASLSLNGHQVALFNGSVLIDGAETLEPVIIHYATGASTLELDVFYYEAASYRAK